MNFMERLSRGENVNIDDFIEEWHGLGFGNINDPLPPPLHEYLGMTWSEYADWVVDHRAIEDILERRSLGLSSNEHKIYKLLQSRANKWFPIPDIVRGINLSKIQIKGSLEGLIIKGHVTAVTEHLFMFKKKSPEFTGNIEFSIEI